MSNEAKYVVREIERLYKSLLEEFQQEVLANLGIKVKDGFYKIKHVPTGLFYQNLKHNGSNVSKAGKVFEKLSYAKSSFNPEKQSGMRIVVSKGSQVKKHMESLGYKFEDRKWSHNQYVVDTKAEEWKIVEV